MTIRHSEGLRITDFITMEQEGEETELFTHVSWANIPDLNVPKMLRYLCSLSGVIEASCVHRIGRRKVIIVVDKSTQLEMLIEQVKEKIFQGDLKDGRV